MPRHAHRAMITPNETDKNSCVLSISEMSFHHWFVSIRTQQSLHVAFSYVSRVFCNSPSSTFVYKPRICWRNQVICPVDCAVV